MGGVGAESSSAAPLPVIVIGAGPAGLSCALSLRARGVAVTVLEALPRDQWKPGSRAIYIHGATLRLLEQMHVGTGRAIGERGVVWSVKRTCWRGRDVFVRQYPPLAADVMPPFSSLPQTEVERILISACASAGVKVVWDAPAMSVDPGPHVVRVADARGREWEARYVVGADGAPSVVRTAARIPMRGRRSRHSYVVVDVVEDGVNPMPVERVYHYEHPAVDGRNVLLVPFAGGWRADLQCRSSDDPAAFSGEQAGSWVAAVMGARYASQIRWVSTYQFLQLMAASMTDESKRILLIGEAAHLFPPFGARGLNSGIADADAAAVAISAALDAPSTADAAAAIVTFATRRRAAAQRNLRAAARALAATDSGNPWRVARRRLAGLAARRSRRAGAWLDAAPYGPRLQPAAHAGESGY